MAVVLDVIKRSLRMVGELAAETGEAPNAAQAEQALVTLNGMFASWENQGIRLEMPTLALTSAIPLPPSHDDAIAFNLAINLCAEYGRAPPPAIAPKARETFRALQMAHGFSPQMVAEAAYVWAGRARW